MITACLGSARSSDRPLRRDCRLHFSSPELWSPAANVRAGQAGTESIKRRGRRSESSVVAGALTWGHGPGAGHGPGLCQLSPDNVTRAGTSSISLSHIHLLQGRHLILFTFCQQSHLSEPCVCVIIGKFVMSNQDNDSLNFLFQVTYFLYSLPKLQW